jgi:hypothetical protein
VDPRIKQSEYSSGDVNEGASQLQIITGAEANKNERQYVGRTTPTSEDNSSVLSYEYSKIIQNGFPHGNGMEHTDTNDHHHVQYGDEISSDGMNVSQRKRPTSFSNPVPQKLPTAHTPSAQPMRQTNTGPKKFRGPTPPKRQSPTNKKEPQVNHVTSSLLVYQQATKSSIGSFNPTQYNYQLPPQEQEPLFLKVNRKPPSPTAADSENKRLIRSGSSQQNSSGSFSRGTVSSSMKGASGSGLENVTSIARRRPSSAPKSRPAVPLSVSNSNDSTISMTSVTPKQQSIPTLQTMYSTPSNNRPMSAPTSNALQADDLDSPKRKKKKKKGVKSTRKEADSRLMRPTLSFLRKTVNKK